MKINSSAGFENVDSMIAVTENHGTFNFSTHGLKAERGNQKLWMKSLL